MKSAMMAQEINHTMARISDCARGTTQVHMLSLGAKLFAASSVEETEDLLSIKWGG
jgi:hypothetical protein